MSSLSNVEVAQHVLAALQPLQAVPLEADLEDEPSVGRLRRRGSAAAQDAIGILTLLDVDGVLIWEDGPVGASAPGFRRRLRGAGADGQVVTQIKYQKPLGVNAIVDKLRAFDASLTPRAANGQPEPGEAPHGPGWRLLQYDPLTWTASPVEAPAAKGHILLLIHGTFSNTENLVREMQKTPAFMQRVASAGYTQVLGFDHFTVSRTPAVNAAVLARLFARSRAELDIVCHSRGGLVARWFAELLDRRPSRKRRIVLVGCPLQGTSLADPQSLRHGLTLMTNVGKVLGQGFGLVPFLAAAAGLMQIVSSLGGLAARTPLVDASIGLLPGVAAMSRIRGNAELDVLNHDGYAPSGSYFAVTSTFRPGEVGWQFWKLFNRLKGAAAEHLVFEQDNDLVVDTSSMTHHVFGPTPDVTNTKSFCVFDANSGVHHTSYFRERQTLDFVARSFGFAE
jgi:hypothetical protein